MDDSKLNEFEEKINYKFKDIALLKMALTHKSYAYEKSNPTYDSFNERIEFLGDAILEHIISDLLYNIKPMMAEGEMTKKRASIVCEMSLSRALRKINGQEYIYLSKGEKKSNGMTKDAIIADAFESILGAIYIDGGYDIAKEICLRLLNEEIEEVLAGNLEYVDYKTKLQELLQKHGNAKIEYVLVNEEGPEHDKVFTMNVLFNDRVIGQGKGRNKKNAEKEAAHDAIQNGGLDVGV